MDPIVFCVPVLLSRIFSQHFAYCHTRIVGNNKLSRTSTTHISTGFFLCSSNTSTICITQYPPRPKTRPPWITSSSFLSRERWLATSHGKHSQSSDAMYLKLHRQACQHHRILPHKVQQLSQLFLRLKHLSLRLWNDLTCKYQP